MKKNGAACGGQFEFEVAVTPGQTTYAAYYFGNTSINCGSGSGNGRRYRCSMKLFASDFPGFEKGAVWNILNDQPIAI